MATNHYSTQSISEEDIAAVTAALRSDTLTGGEQLAAFEAALSEYTGAREAVALSSATAGLHAALAVLDLPEGSEVIVPAISFVATANAALYCGLMPRFVDIDYATGCISPEAIEAAITPQTRAIIAVHYAGNLCNMSAINALAKGHDLVVIEDAAHALGSHLDRQHAGTFSTMGVFSFHPVKPITTAEGGAVITDDPDLARKLRLFRSHGVERGRLWQQDMVQMGYNYRLSELHAALGCSQMRQLEPFIARRNAIAATYDDIFKGSDRLFSLRFMPGLRPGYHLYPLLLAPELWCAKEDLFSALLSEGIGVQVHYKPIYRHRYYADRLSAPECPQAEAFYRAELSLPCHARLKTDEAVHIAKRIQALTC
jgi:UDP-4-amino-4,6-dideoxy-L-N-acetyl-beta-L-altrosamine transaminase